MSETLAEATEGRSARWTRVLLPPNQRKDRTVLADELDLGSGDVTAKRSRFWALLILSAVIATAGVVADSTATVIGAMIIAPLATPIMGTAFGIVVFDGLLARRARRLLGLGTVAVVAVGILAALFLPENYDLLGNAQVSGRTSPTLVDMAAAVATGFAGAIGLVRRDVSDVLPGVAVAISLVPPLAVCGVCLGQGAAELAFGAFLLFSSNVIAMVLAGTVVFALAYKPVPPGPTKRSLRKAYLTISALLVTVTLLLALNTLLAVATGVWEERITQAADQWLKDIPQAEVVGVDFESTTAVVTVLTPSGPPPADQLRDSLRGEIPAAFDLVVKVERGQRIDVGPVD